MLAAPVEVVGIRPDGVNHAFNAVDSLAYCWRVPPAFAFLLFFNLSPIRARLTRWPIHDLFSPQ
jgi:hypothetical protein